MIFSNSDGDITTWEELRNLVEASGGVLRSYMNVPRDLEEAGRLGVNVRATISRKLDGVGLGHLPADLPANQWDEIVLFQRGTAAADVVEAVRGTNFAKAEDALRRLNTKGDAEKLAAIAAIVNGEG